MEAIEAFPQYERALGGSYTITLFLFFINLDISEASQQRIFDQTL